VDKGRGRTAVAAALFLPLLGCAASETPPRPPAWAAAPAVAPPEAKSAPASDAPAIPAPQREPQLQPEIGAGAPSYQPYLYRPGATAPMTAPGATLGFQYNGPITGYGPGGMAYPPGAPPNPPYFYGGTNRR